MDMSWERNYGSLTIWARNWFMIPLEWYSLVSLTIQGFFFIGFIVDLNKAKEIACIRIYTI